MVRVLKPRDYRVMPWKNGGGTTTEIYIHPEGADWNAFEWRVGIADIRQSGPFSSFPGIDRSIMLLDCPECSAMTLTIDGAEVGLPLREFVDFSGEAATFGTLHGDPVRDFNVMARRSSVRHQRGFRQLEPGASLRWPLAQWQFAYVVEGDAVIRTETVSPAAGSHASAATLGAGDALLADAEPCLELRAGSSGCELVWAAFSRG